MQETKKGDKYVAARLNELELSERLNTVTKSELMRLAPGPLSIEQINILEGRSAFLDPPGTDMPTAADPDLAGQKVIMAKVVKYVTGTLMQSPHFTAARITSRYQNPVLAVHTGFMRLLGTRSVTVESDRGVEFVPGAKIRTPGNKNGPVPEGDFGLTLSVILQEAASSDKLKWLRWEMVNGRQVAVFSFAVRKEESHYRVDYCCFPVSEVLGTRYEYNTTWQPYKTLVGYHGQFFVAPETGTILRVVTQAELKPSDFVHSENMRIDYGPVNVGGRTYVLPVKSFTFAEVVPYPEEVARYPVQQTLFIAHYANYEFAKTAKK